MTAAIALTVSSMTFCISSAAAAAEATLVAAAAVAQKMTRRMITLGEAGARCASVVLVYGNRLPGTTGTEIKLPRLMGATG